MMHLDQTHRVGIGIKIKYTCKMSIESCCDHCSADISTATSNAPGGWKAATFASTPSTPTDTGWDMPATPDYNNLTWFGTSTLGACYADWKDCSAAGEQFAGFQDNFYGGSNNGVESSNACATCITGKHVLCSNKQINTCPGVEVFGDGGFSNSPTKDWSKIVYDQTTNSSFTKDFPRGKTTCIYPQDAVKTPLQMQTVTRLISGGKIDPVVGDALATNYCTQVVTSPNPDAPPAVPTCKYMIPLHADNTPPGVFNEDIMKFHNPNGFNTYTGFMGEYVPWTTPEAATLAETAAKKKGGLVLWVFGPLASMDKAGFGGYNAVWANMKGPPMKALQFNETPSYGIVVWSSAEKGMAKFKLNMSSIPEPSVQKDFALVTWAVSPPNQPDDSAFTAVWTEPPVVFYAPALDSEPRCNTIEFVVSTLVKTSVIWGRKIARAPIAPPTDEVCLTSPVTGKPMPKCSRFRAAGEGGNACRTWALSRKVRGVNTAPDLAYIEYCNSNSANADCDCLKRNVAIGSTDQVVRERYQAMAGSGMPVPDTCWFGPCKDNDGNYSLVTESILNPNYPNKTCPDNVCMEVVQAWAKRDAKVSNIDMNMDCKTQYTDYADNKYACDNCTVGQPAPTKDAPTLKKGFASTAACQTACSGLGPSGGLSGGAIAGIVVGSIVGVVMIVVIIVLIRKRGTLKKP